MPRLTNPPNTDRHYHLPTAADVAVLDALMDNGWINVVRHRSNGETGGWKVPIYDFRTRDEFASRDEGQEDGVVTSLNSRVDDRIDLARAMLRLAEVAAEDGVDLFIESIIDAEECVESLYLVDYFESLVNLLECEKIASMAVN